MRPLTLALLASLSGAACVTAAGQAWMQGDEEAARSPEHQGWSSQTRAVTANKSATNGGAPDDLTTKQSSSPAATAATGANPSDPSPTEEVVSITAQGTAAGPVLAFKNGERFRNTYYDFPREESGAKKDAGLYDPTCALIANVTRDFHDHVCVQGSGRLSTGETVSFAKRDCACAELCPRTNQKICFERLDPARFPSGRGALGRAITPMRSVAVDSSVIPLGTLLYIPEFKGVVLPNGGKHDGCFVAEDRGIKVTGRQIDIFTGDPEATRHMNQRVPSNRSVRVYADDAHCRAIAARSP